MTVSSIYPPPRQDRQSWSWLARLTRTEVTATGIAVLVAVLALAPVVSVIVVATGGSGDLWPHLVRYVMPVAITQTALLLGGVAVLTTAVGVGAAWVVTTFEFPGRTTFAWLLALPLAIPTYIVAYVYVDVLGVFGPVQTALRAIFGWTSPTEYWFPEVRSIGGAVFVIGFVLYPYVYLAARAMFQTQCAVFADAARILGARPWRLARRITLPLARPAIAVGLALALLETLNDIGASEYLGVQTLTLSVFTTWLNRGSLAGAAQIACLMLVVVALLVGLERYGRTRRGFVNSMQDTQVASRLPLTGAARWLAIVACLVPMLIGFAVPAGYLAYEVVLRGLLVGFDPSLARHVVSTIAFAGIATAITLALGFAAVTSLRWLQRPFVAGCVHLAGIGYAVPGTVLALGLLTPLVAVDNGIGWAARLATGASVGLVIMGSGTAVVIAYVIRFLAISTGFVRVGFARISNEFDDTARMLGAGPSRVVRTVHWPLARPAIYGAALLVFVDCLKELPATLLLRPLNVETLSTYIYQFATRGSFEEGSLAALIIVAAGILPIIRLSAFADVTLPRRPSIRYHNAATA